MNKDKTSTQKAPKEVSAETILRAVASSSALESTQSIADIQKKLARPSARFSHLKLAL